MAFCTEYALLSMTHTSQGQRCEDFESYNQSFCILQSCPHSPGTGYYMIRGVIALRPHYMSLVTVQVEHKDDTDLVKNE